MATVNAQNARELFEVLNPYQVAVMAFTSPAEINLSDKPERVTLTSKDSYVWAAAVAYILTHRPGLDEKQVLECLHIAIERSGRTYFTQVLNQDLGTLNFVGSGIPLVDDFLRAAGFSGNALKEACALTQDAIRSLEWLGVIEDPIRKKIAGILLAVYAIAGPLHFSSEGPNQFTYETVTWHLTAKNNPTTDQTRFTFNLKVHQIVTAVKDEIIHALEVLEDATDPVSKGEAREKSQQMSAEELQKRLMELRYYNGAIDGKAWGKTYVALKRFQEDRGLKVTGYPDSETVRALRESKRW